jgi:hypothetical protein
MSIRERHAFASQSVGIWSGNPAGLRSQALHVAVPQIVAQHKHNIRRSNLFGTACDIQTTEQSGDEAECYSDMDGEPDRNSSGPKSRHQRIRSRLVNAAVATCSIKLCSTTDAVHNGNYLLLDRWTNRSRGSLFAARSNIIIIAAGRPD